MLRYKIAIKLIAKELPIRTMKSAGIYYETRDKVMVVGKYFDLNDYGFIRHLGSVHKCPKAQDYSYTLWAILHEVGHFKTEEKYGDNFANREYFNDNAKYMMRNVSLQNTFHNERKEWEATNWAIKWIGAHPKLARVLNILVK